MVGFIIMVVSAGVNLCVYPRFGSKGEHAGLSLQLAYIIGHFLIMNHTYENHNSKSNGND